LTVARAVGAIRQHGATVADDQAALLGAPCAQAIQEASMKTHSILALGALALSVTAFAGEGAHPAADSASHEVKMMDANQDGVVSPAEHTAGAKKMFGIMDANRDGKVTPAEMDAAQASMKGGDKTTGHDKTSGHEMSSTDKIKVVDANADGVLTAQEHADGSKTMFEKMDQDKDGNLTLAEVQTGHEEMMGSTHR
jgi:Ca2+-binding EF-hand superfamily protein